MPSIGGVNINWDETKPSGTDSVAIGDDQIRSDKIALRSALAAEHTFSASGGANTGAHALGSARPFYDVQSNVSSTGSDGRLMLTSDTSRLFGVGSGGTVFLGGATVISAGSFPATAPQRHYWAVEFGEGKTVSGATTVSIPNSGYSGVPFIQVTNKITNLITDGGASIMWISGVGNASFVVNSRLTNGVTTSSHSFCWQSVGTRVL